MSTQPVMIDFPDHFETNRLLIRAPRPGDGAAVNAAIRESFENLRQWMMWAQTIPTIEDTEAGVRRSAANFLLREDLRMHLYRKPDGLFVGSSGLHFIDWSLPRFEIGYWVRASLEGQGYITEAVKGITRFAFDQLGALRLEIMCDSRNKRSAAVAERCGFHLEAHLRCERRGVDGTVRDTLIYAKLAGE